MTSSAATVSLHKQVLRKPEGRALILYGRETIVAQDAPNPKSGRPTPSSHFRWHPFPEAHLHLECYPAYRMPGRLKYLAGSELGAGLFTSDTLSEAKAEELRQVAVQLE
jgi:hypothetical protein